MCPYKSGKEASQGGSSVSTCLQIKEDEALEMTIDQQHGDHQRLWVEQFQWYAMDEKMIRVGLRENGQRNWSLVEYC